MGFVPRLSRPGDGLSPRRGVCTSVLVGRLGALFYRCGSLLHFPFLLKLILIKSALVRI